VTGQFSRLRAHPGGLARVFPDVLMERALVPAIELK
jgi:hypothetical protein